MASATTQSEETKSGPNQTSVEPNNSKGSSKSHGVSSGRITKGDKDARSIRAALLKRMEQLRGTKAVDISKMIESYVTPNDNTADRMYDRKIDDTRATLQAALARAESKSEDSRLAWQMEDMEVDTGSEMQSQQHEVNFNLQDKSVEQNFTVAENSEPPYTKY